MEVKTGYKLTEVGVIPEDWVVKPLGEFGKFKNGINKGKEDFGHGFPFINLMDVFGIPKVSASTTEFGLVNTTTAERDLYELKSGDVLFVRSSVKPEGVGLTTLIPQDLPNTVFSGFLIRFRASRLLELGFKEHCFWDEGFRTRLISNSTVSANTNINQDALKQLQIAFPPTLPEQRSIAIVLSDMDALLGTLDQLIAKKRDLKQATMQQLLTGKKRLPGFSEGKGYKQTEIGVIPEDWDVATFAKITTNDGLVRGPFGGALKKQFFVKDGYKVYEQRNAIYSSVEIGNYFIDINKFNELNRFKVDPGNLIVSCSGTIGCIYKIPDGAPPGVINQALLKIKLDDAIVDGSFFLSVFRWDKFQEKITDSSHGGAMQNLVGMEIFKNTLFQLPSLPEQTAIATVLSDMDTELAALEQRRDKTRDLKQGMMQELLTGRTRLL